MEKDALYQGPIFVKKSPLHGYGVFAAEDIPAETIIEACHTLTSFINTSNFDNYCYKGGILPLGYGAIYNHADQANVRCDYSKAEKILYFTTTRPVKRHEELCTCYGASWFSVRKLKRRRPSWLRQVYWQAKGLPLRLTLVCLALLAFIQGLKSLLS